MIFYKTTLRSFLTDKFIPGIVTTDIKRAIRWKDRLCSKNACIVEVHYTGELGTVSTNKRLETNHWLANQPTKARINSICKYKLI